jgi:hypothetical protein
MSPAATSPSIIAMTTIEITKASRKGKGEKGKGTSLIISDTGDINNQ